MSFDIADLPRSLDLEVTTAFQNAVLNSKLLNLTATEVSGQLVFDSANGFQSDLITGLVFDTPVMAKIGPELTTTLAPLAAAEIKLLASVEAIKNWQGIGQALPFSGETTLIISVLVNDNISIDIDSDLVGVEIDMPGTWGKKENLRAPIQLRWDSADIPQWDIFWFHRASALIQNRQKNRISGLIDLTPRAEPIAWKSRKLDPGLTIVGDIPLLNIPEWAPLWSRFKSSALGSKAFQPHFSKVKLQKLIWGSSDLGSAEVDFDFSLTEPQGAFSFPWLAGRIRFLSEGEADGSLVNIDITQLEIDQVPNWLWAENHMSDLYPNNILDKILPARVSIGNIFFKNSNLGCIEFRLERQAQKILLFDELIGEIGGIRILSPTELIWMISNESSRTELSLTAEFDDLGFSLHQVGLPKLLETRNGNLEAAWSWKGSPVDFEINRVTGKLDLRMDSGSFLSANTEMTDAMRLLSLLNLSGLFRRANINQLFDPGVTFDRAVGDFEFQEGHLSIPDFAIEGSGGYFNFSSEVDLISDTIDGELVVTLPLVENIPWVAALAGGIPMAAGTYLVSKIFEDQVNQLSSGVYSVTGSLSSPKVIFERVFDAQTR